MCFVVVLFTRNKKIKSESLVLIHTVIHSMYHQAEWTLYYLYTIELLVQFVNTQPACLHVCLIILNLNVTHA